jgi:hydroxymethylglutaryl-CoA reductase (NADPH)
MATNSGLSDNDMKLLERLHKNEIKSHELDELSDNPESIRRKFMEFVLNVSLENISKSVIEAKEARPNIENMIGSVQLPLGIAGPLKINGENAKGEFFIPLATTEGALVASVNRGCSVINKAGGAASYVMSNMQARSILFKAAHPKKFCDWVKNNFASLKKAGEQDERFLDIKEIETYAVGINVWLLIKADTKDAMGMNMVTIAGKNLAEYITANHKEAEFVSESGNMCTDKKPSAMSLLNSRGKKVIATVELSSDLIKSHLKTTPAELVEMNYRKNLLGSAAAGSLGYNAHFANIIAAMFIATGQDAAHVVDGSLGFTTAESTEKGVLFSVTIPSLHVGTIGGGTGLRTQKECLSVLGVAGAGNPPGSNSIKLAEIVACAVLAGEISLLGALCTQDLTKAHMRLNRL